MRNIVVISVALLSVLGCGPGSRPEAKTSGLDDNVESGHENSADAAHGSVKPVANNSAALGKSETAEWWKVAQTDSDDSAKRPPRQIGRVAVSSDPLKHGEALRFRFRVNGTAISGVFQAPGGKNSTFAIPSGTVAFTIDECGWEEQGFPLGAGEEIALSCKLMGDGDCCEVAIPVEEETAKQERHGKRSDSE